MTYAQRRGLITYTLQEVQQYPSPKVPASHQEEALSRLNRWFKRRDAAKGGILVLPTGGGKTFTATRFLTTGPLSQGHKVIWLAHTHHLLDQAFAGFGRGPEGRYEVGHIGGSRQKLTLRTVSGTLGHGNVSEIKSSDDVLIITLQTLAGAMRNGPQTGLKGFLTAARQTGLSVVFDECHHAPAPSYRKLIEALREAVPDLVLLGLTATPTYTNVRKQGYLTTLFPQGILYQVSPQELMAEGILARPIMEEPTTNIRPEFTDQDYQQWAGSYRDIPEKVIAHLADNRQRNTLIANAYVQNKAKYGQTIIFADRWYQCTALVELLRERGVKADAIFTHQDSSPRSVEARNKLSSDENEVILSKFKKGELDVLVNIRMLTEGTDVPNVQTVFLTRQTTSRILLTQMVGRALRGPKFGGTRDAYIVAFIDEWKQNINWARWDDLLSTMAEDDTATVHRDRLPLEMISIELIAQLARELDAEASTAIPFTSLIPVGWYVVSYDAAVIPLESDAQVSENGRTEDEEAVKNNDTVVDNVETVRQLIPVYSQDQLAYLQMFKELNKLERSNLDDFSDVEISEDELLNIRGWVYYYFESGERTTKLHQDVLSVVRHRAINGAWPKFTPFEAREQHNVDEIAQRLAFDLQLSRVTEDQTLRGEFQNSERLWTSLYRNYDQFKRQYDASVNRLLYLQQYPESVPDLGRVEERFAPEEVPTELKKLIRSRDKRCLCCRATTKLQIDHIVPRYKGGEHTEKNLQTLCRACNAIKGTKEIDFRKALTPLTSAEEVRANADWIFRRTPRVDAGDMENILRRITNMAFECTAAAAIKYSVERSRGSIPHYQILIGNGNNLDWIQPVLEQAFAIWRRDDPDFKQTVRAVRFFE